MTQWLEYFCEGLSTQLHEVKELGKQAIKQDLFADQYQLSEWQRLAIEYITTHNNLTIQEFEKICPNVTRRTLQRELKDLLDKDIIEVTGATSNTSYRLKVVE